MLFLGKYRCTRKESLTNGARYKTINPRPPTGYQIPPSFFACFRTLRAPSPPPKSLIPSNLDQWVVSMYRPHTIHTCASFFPECYFRPYPGKSQRIHSTVVRRHDGTSNHVRKKEEKKRKKNLAQMTIKCTSGVIEKLKSADSGHQHSILGTEGEGEGGQTVVCTGTRTSYKRQSGSTSAGRMDGWVCMYTPHGMLHRQW